MSKEFAEANYKRKKKEEEERRASSSSNYTNNSGNRGNSRKITNDKSMLRKNEAQNRSQTDFNNNKDKYINNRTRQGSAQNRTANNQVQQRPQQSYGNQQRERRSYANDKSIRQVHSAQNTTREEQEKKNSSVLKNSFNVGKEALKQVWENDKTTALDVGKMDHELGGGKSRWADEMVLSDEQEKKQKEKVEKNKVWEEKKYQESLKKRDESEKKIQEITKDATGLEKALYGAVESGVGMATDIAFGPLSLAHMGVRSYGAQRGKAQAEGATEAEDRWNAFLQAGKEVGTEMMFRGAGLAKKVAGGKGLSIGDKMADILTRNMSGRKGDILSGAIRYGGAIGEENLEEVAGWGLDPLIKELAYGKNVRMRQAQDMLKQESDALRSNITDENTARAVSAYLSSNDFLEKNKQAYIDSGVGEEQATLMAEKMRDYLTASLTGDTLSMANLQDEISNLAAKKTLDWDFNELKDTIAATTLLTGVTGLPGAVSSTARGARIKEALGSEGLNALANTAIDFEDDEMSLKAQAIRDRLAAGKDVTATQVNDLAQGLRQQERKDQERERTYLQTAENKMKQNNQVSPFTVDQDGGVYLGKVTGKAYDQEQKQAEDVLKAASEQRFVEEGKSLTDTEVKNGAKAIAAFKTGIFTVDDANQLNFSNQAVRTAFQKATGIDLNQYIVKGRDGKIDIPKTNTATKNALFAMAADNLSQSAEAETRNWMDEEKGRVVNEISSRMGQEGTMALQEALDTVDERDRSAYLMTANAVDFAYQAGKNTGRDWDEVKDDITRSFPGIKPEALQEMYESGIRDREASLDTARGMQTKIGEAISSSGEAVPQKGELIVETKEDPKGSTVRLFSEMARSLGVTIHLVDDLPVAKGSEKQANGQYRDGEIWLNVNSSYEKNVGYIAMHEITHHLKLYAPEQYKKLEDLVREKWFSQDPDDMQNRIREKIEAYQKANQNLTEEQALEEIIADAAHEFLTDRNFAKTVCDTDISLGKAIINSIKSAIRGIYRIFGAGGIQETYMDSLFSELGILEEAEKLWMEAYKQAAANQAAIGIVEWDEKNNKGIYKLSASEVKNDTEVKRIKQSIKNNLHREELRNPVASVNVIQARGMTDKQILDTVDAEFKKIGRGVDVKNFGFVDLSTKIVNDALNRYVKSAIEKSVILSLPKVLKKGIQIDEDINHKSRKHDSFTFAAKIEFIGDDKNADESIKTDGIVGVLVKKTKGNRYKAHRVLLSDGSPFEFNKKSEITTSGMTTLKEGSEGPAIISDNNNIPQTNPESNRNSITDEELARIKAKEELKESGVEQLPDDTTARYSLTSWEKTNKKKKLNDLIKAGHSEKEAKKWIDDLNSIAAMILNDPGRLDYLADPDYKFLKDNGDYYKKTLDASTLCDKRRYYQGTYDAIMHRLKDAALDDQDVVRIRTLLKEHGYTSPCGICYVESQRKNLGRYAKEWYDGYARKNEIHLDDVTTSDGLDRLKKTNPQVANDFVKAMNAKGVQSPKVVKLRTDYREDIMKMRPETVEYLNKIGGLRFHSFSDFETVHTIDTMQAVMDMATKNMMGMAYAKVPAFAAIFGPTGIKINLSLIMKTDENGNAVYDEDGKLVFDPVEGIDYEEAKQWRDKYPDNVAFIVVGKDMQSTVDALNDDRIDYVIPFHKSKWSDADLKRLGLNGYVDFATGHQDNKVFVSEYWNYNKTGKENAEEYLRRCKKKGVKPVFEQLLVDNGDGSYSLPEDGSMDNYWKLLIEGKMYNHLTRKGAKQKPVKPNFNMEEARRVLNAYEGGADTLPVAEDVVNEFVDEYENKHNTNESYRFSLSSPVERVKDLIAVHNLKEDDLRGALDLGGFPMPSIAITKDNMGHDKYGDISLVFGSDTIDPKAHRTNQVFGGDAYTPTFPAIRFKPNKEVSDRISDVYYENTKKIGYDAMRPMYALAEDIENQLNNEGGEAGLKERYKSKTDLMRTFLKMNNQDVDDVVSRTETTLSDTEEKLRKHFINALGEDAIREFEAKDIPNGREKGDFRRQWTQDHLDEIKKAYKDFLQSGSFTFTDEQVNNVISNMKLFDFMKFIRNALDYMNNGSTTVKEEVDRKATEQLIEEKAKANGYNEWIDDLLTGIEEKKGIRNNKEYFTHSGNRRSWDALHDEVTLDNVVRIMRTELAAGGNGLLWKNPKGAAQKEYKSLDEIMADEDRLQMLQDEEFKALEESATQKLYNVCSSIVGHNPGGFYNQFGAVLDVGEYIAEILNKTKQKDGIKRMLTKDYNLKVTNQEMDSLMDALDEIASLPTGYFEAKPRRAVGIDEIQAAIVPDTIDPKLKDRLSDFGVNVYEYDPNAEGDRAAKLNQALDEKQLRFSISSVDSDGNKLTEGQRKFFLESKAVDDMGRLIPVYHVTRSGGFTVFDPSYSFDETSISFSNRLNFALYYSSDDGNPDDWNTAANTRFGNEEIIPEDKWEENIGHYKVYLNMVNPLILDGDYLDERDIYEWPSYAKEQGYDGIIYRDFDEDGAHIYQVFNSNQIKDTRNMNPTEDPEIRYSITPEDDAIAQLAEEMDDLEEIPMDDPVLEEGRVRMARSKKEFVDSLNAKWNERWLTEGKILDIKSVQKDIRNLVMSVMQNSDTDRKYKTDVVNQAFKDAKSAYWLLKDKKTAEAAELLWNTARGMVENVDFINDEMFNHYKDLRDYLKKTDINVGPEYQSDIHFTEFRKRNFGRMRLKKGPTNIDNVYKELSEMWPEFFDEEKVINPADQLYQIEDVLDKIQPYREAYTSEQAKDLAWDIAEDLLNIVYHGKEYVSIADLYKEKYGATTYKARYEQKVKAMKARHQDAIDKIRAQRDERVRKEREKFKEYKQKQKDVKERAKRFGSIEKNYTWLAKRLVEPNKDEGIPEEFRRSLAELLYMFDFQTERSRELERKYGIAAKNKFKIWELKARYEEIASEDDTGIFIYDGNLIQIMNDLADRIDGTSIDQLTTEDLVAVDTILSALVHDMRQFNKIRVAEKEVEIQDIGDETIDKLNERIKKFGKRKTYYGARSGIDRLLNEGEETPVYFFERIGGGMQLMYKELRKGNDQHIRNMDFIRKRFEQICGEYFNKKRPGSELENWRKASSAIPFELKCGTTIKLTPAQIMSLYCHSKRAQSLGHILGAGIVASPITTGQKLETKIKGNEEQVDSAMISYAELQEMIGRLTADQIKVADELQSLLNNEMAAWGNETSMKLYGYKQFLEKNYFPIKVSKEVLAKDANQQEVMERIKNFGFTKGTIRGANNAIMIDDIFSVVADHCNKMSLYNAFAIPITDFMRVYNYKRKSENGETNTVQQKLGEAFTPKANSYIMNFIRDINGNTKTKADSVESLSSKALANYKKAAIGFNARVALQQPTAIFRALMVIDPKYFSYVKPYPGAMKEMFEHCPIALWKKWGHYDVDLGRDIEDVMMNKDWSVYDTFTMGAYGGLDNITWTAIWQAVKAEVEDKHPDVEVGSQEYWDLCNERASEVFDKTQVVDSLFHRSETMRSKNVLTKMMTSFMAEPTLTYNVFRDSLVNAAEMWKDGDKERAAKTLTRMTVVLLLNAAAVSGSAALWDVVRGKDEKSLALDLLKKITGDDGDDDKDKEITWQEKWFHNFLANFSDNANMLNNIYFIKDIYGLKDGWGTSNMALEGFEKFWTGFNQMKKKVMGKEKKGYEKTWYQIMQNTLGGIGYIIGAPIYTAMRDAKNLYDIWLADVFAATPHYKYTLSDGTTVETKPTQTEKTDEKQKTIDLNKYDGGKYSGEQVDNIGVSKTMENTESPIGQFFSSLFTGGGKNKTEDKEEGKVIVKPSGETVLFTKDGKIKQKAFADMTDMEKVKYLNTKFAQDVPKEKRQEKLWDKVMEGYNDYIERGDYEYINRMRYIMQLAGGDLDAFDKKVLEASKSAYKKTIYSDPTPEQVAVQDSIHDYMLEHGMSDAQISEICYKSYVARDLKAALRLNNEEYIINELAPLIRAGLSYDDFVRLYENRNRGKDTYSGKYAEEESKISTGTYKWPAQGVITSGFGYRTAPTKGASSNHEAIDIGGNIGDPIQAADGGTVTYAGWYRGYGYQVRIKHQDGSETRYSHLNGYNVQPGDIVKQGEQIAEMGSTGVSTGPHLDFQVRVNGSFVNPLEYLAG